MLQYLPFKIRTGLVKRQNLVIEYSQGDSDEHYQTKVIQTSSCLNHMLMWKQLDKGDSKAEFVIAFGDDDGRWSRNLVVNTDQEFVFKYPHEPWLPQKFCKLRIRTKRRYRWISIIKDSFASIIGTSGFTTAKL